MYKILITIIIFYFFAFEANAQQNKIKVEPLPNLSMDTLSSVSLDNFFSDKINDGIDVVGVGATSFLASEGIRFNNKLIQFLVLKKGFKTIALPRDNWGLGRLNSYLTNGEPANSADITSITKDTFDQSTFYTFEHLELIKWVKDYNNSHLDAPIQFKGTMFTPPTPPGYIIAKYIMPVDSLLAVNISKKKARDQSDSITYVFIINWVKQNNTKIRGKLSADQYNDLAIEIANLESHSLYLNYSDNLKKAEFLDSCMLQTVAKLVTENKKIIIYGDNKMIARHSFNNGIVKKGFGMVLDEKFGKSYYAIATDYYNKSDFYWVNPQSAKLEKIQTLSSKGSTAYILHQKYKVNEGLVSFNELIKTNIPILLNIHDLYSKHTEALMQKAAPFDVLATFKDLTPVKFLRDIGVH